MIKHIRNLLRNFPGPANQTRCFMHTVNLVVKSILKPFDTQKSKNMQAFEDALAKVHEQTTEYDKNEDKQDEDDEDGDEVNDLTMMLKLIRSMLLKVCLCPISLSNS